MGVCLHNRTQRVRAKHASSREIRKRSVRLARFSSFGCVLVHLIRVFGLIVTLRVGISASHSSCEAHSFSLPRIGVVLRATWLFSSTNTWGAFMDALRVIELVLNYSSLAGFLVDHPSEEVRATVLRVHGG